MRKNKNPIIVCLLIIALSAMAFQSQAADGDPLPVILGTVVIVAVGGGVALGLWVLKAIEKSKNKSVENVEVLTNIFDEAELCMKNGDSVNALEKYKAYISEYDKRNTSKLDLQALKAKYAQSLKMVKILSE